MAISDLGEEIVVDVSSLSSIGSGVAKSTLYDSSITFFIPGAVPGDQVKAKVISTEGPLVHCELVEILSKSACRVEPVCSYFGVCGGCSVQHVDYPSQLAAKRNLVVRALSSSVDGVASLMGDVVPARAVIGSRTRGRFHVSIVDGVHRIGLHARSSREVIDVDSCPALDKRIDSALRWVRRAWMEYLPDKCQVEFVVDEVKDRVVAALYPPLDENGSLASLMRDWVDLPDELPPSWLSLQVYPNMESAGFFPVEGGRPLLFRPDVFTQSDIVSNRVLVSTVLAAAKIGRYDRVLDLFCGVGNFSLPLAKSAKSVEGVEWNARSVFLAKKNALRWEMFNVEFFRNDAAYVLSSLAHKYRRFEVVVLDPPRSGLGESIAVLDSICIKRIVYVSCDPKYLSKDLALLRSFKVVSIQPLDLFPQTMHVETVVVLEKLAPGESSNIISSVVKPVILEKGTPRFKIESL